MNTLSDLPLTKQDIGPSNKFPPFPSVNAEQPMIDLRSQKKTSKKSDYIMVSSGMLPQMVRQKLLSEKDSWYKTDDGNGNLWSTVDLSMPPNLEGVLRLKPDPGIKISPAERELAHKRIEGLYTKINDLTIDIIDIIWTKWIERKDKALRAVEISADEILKIRGLTPLLDGSFETNLKSTILEHMDIIFHIWIDAPKVVLFEKHGKKTKRIEKIVTGKFLLIDGYSIQKVDGQPTSYTWRVSPGTAMDHFLEDPNLQFMLMTKKVLAYHPTKQSVEKRLARHFIWQFRIRNLKKDYLRSFDSGRVLERSCIKVDKRNGSRFKERIEQALDQIKSDGIIRNWQYADGWDENIVAKKGWVEDWLNMNLIIEPPMELIEFNESVSTKYIAPPLKEIEKPTENLFAAKVKDFLKSNKMSQLVLAEKLQVSPQFLSAILRGNKQASQKVTVTFNSLLNQN